MFDGGLAGDLLLTVMVAAGVLLLGLVLVDESRRPPAPGRRWAGVLAIALALGAGWLLVGQMHVEDGVTCSIWPSTDAFGPDASATAIASQPAGLPRLVARECVSQGVWRTAGAAGLLVVAAAGYGVARSRGRRDDRTTDGARARRPNP